MPKKAGIAITAMGAVLILSALLLLLYNRHEDAQAGQEAESLLVRVEAAIDTPQVIHAQTPEERQLSVETKPSIKTPHAKPDAAEPLEAEMPVVLLDGYEYIGYVEIPSLRLKLPVMADWDYTRLKFAPCRQFGSSRTDDLVIAAHNYENHFGRLNELSEGDTVRFTDMDGIVNTYSVEKLETLKPDEVDAVQNSGYDLVLYTCTKGGKTRVAVFCDRAQAPAETEPSVIAQEK